MVDKNDPPIVAMDFLGGVNRVVDIGEYRVSRGMSRREKSSCRHLHQFYDEKERRIWCSECEGDVDPFDAYIGVMGSLHTASKAIKIREKLVKEAESFNIRSIAAKAIDTEWRRRDTVPCCPHCNEGLLPEDCKNGFNLASKSLTRAKRGKK